MVKFLSYGSEEQVVGIISVAVNISRKKLLNSPGVMRQTTMDMLYRHAGFTNPQIGRIMGIDDSTVSQGRKRLRSRIQTDSKLSRMVEAIDRSCQE